MMIYDTFFTMKGDEVSINHKMFMETRSLFLLPRLYLY